ncbi:uncharacterized protein LOC135162355 isoform X2 [Diachasmimorpha longicaudata]|uniref:uncharacterized protein LOC135162355 isoform X2 n=1 Tax=Diachasmimorpha longicaudata TaxID=58733 RepID=UPI0030B8E8B9
MEEKKDGEVRMSERRAQLTCQLTVYHCIDTSHVAVGPPGHLKNVDPGRLVGSDVTGHILCSHGSRERHGNYAHWILTAVGVVMQTRRRKEYESSPMGSRR